MDAEIRGAAGADADEERRAAVATGAISIVAIAALASR
jgi:hypothetical protein